MISSSSRLGGKPVWSSAACTFATKSGCRNWTAATLTAMRIASCWSNCHSTACMHAPPGPSHPGPRSDRSPRPADQFAGRTPCRAGAFPAQQGLGADDRAAFGDRSGWKCRKKSVTFRMPAVMPSRFPDMLHMERHGIVEKLPAVAPGCLGPVHGRIGTTQQAVTVNAVLGEQRIPMLAVCTSRSMNMKRFVQRSVQSFGLLLYFDAASADLFHPREDKLLSRQRARVSGCPRPADRRCASEFDQTGSDVLPKAGVHVGKVI